MLRTEGQYMLQERGFHFFRQFVPVLKIIVVRMSSVFTCLATAIHETQNLPLL